MHRVLSVVLAGLLATSVFAADDVKGSVERIIRLHKEYKATADYVDQLLIASQLARVGDYTYWEFVRREARKVIRRDERSFGSMPTVRWGIIRRMPISNPQMEMSASQPSEPSRRRPRYLEVVDVEGQKEHGLDLWRMQALANGARLGNRDDKRMLQRALESPRVEIAAIAALGLARLHDVKSATDIHRAAFRVGQVHDNSRAPFLEALVYLNDAHATKLAVELAGNDTELLRALQEIAVENRFDPFYNPEEEH